VLSASIAESVRDTTVGFGVITSDTGVEDGLRYFAATRRVTSVSVIIPASPPLAPTTKEASPRLFASICATVKTLSVTFDNIGFLGRNTDTGLSILLPSVFFFTECGRRLERTECE